ncbi:MAG: nucleotidyl transferase AbiEii/AbiGii toxin family protein [Kofleriaceae bacterium]
MTALRDDAQRDGETAAQAVRHHLLAGLIERVARTDPGFVLRGGMLTRAWIDPLPRPTRDLDYVGDFAFDVEATVDRFRPALGHVVDDGMVFDPERFTARGIWLDSEFPGVHLDLAAGIATADHTLGVDIGFHDPLVPPATEHAGVRAVRPETQLAWKLHGLVEMADMWRPKDLADLWLIVTRVPLERTLLAPAIAAAFTSRGYTVDDARAAFDRPHWATKSARVRWATTRGLELATAIAEIRERLP